MSSGETRRANCILRVTSSFSDGGPRSPWSDRGSPPQVACACGYHYICYPRSEGSRDLRGRGCNPRTRWEIELGKVYVRTPHLPWLLTFHLSPTQARPVASRRAPQSPRRSVPSGEVSSKERIRSVGSALSRHTQACALSGL